MPWIAPQNGIEVASGTTREEAMTPHIEHEPVTNEARSVGYPPDLLPLLQCLLADLVDIDLADERGLEAIRRCPGEDELKRTMIDRLRQHHQERRGAVVRDLTAVQQRVAAVFS
jgi:hypothetical protein